MSPLSSLPRSSPLRSSRRSSPPRSRPVTPPLSKAVCDRLGPLSPSRWGEGLSGLHPIGLSGPRPAHGPVPGQPRRRCDGGAGLAFGQPVSRAAATSGARSAGPMPFSWGPAGRPEQTGVALPLVRGEHELDQPLPVAARRRRDGVRGPGRGQQQAQQGRRTGGRGQAGGAGRGGVDTVVGAGARSHEVPAGTPDVDAGERAGRPSSVRRCPADRSATGAGPRSG